MALHVLAWAVLTAIFYAALNLGAVAVYRRWTAEPPTRPLEHEAIDRAIFEAMQYCGVNVDGALTEDRELGHKWHEVLTRATRTLGYETRTVGDLREWLS